MISRKGGGVGASPGKVRGLYSPPRRLSSEGFDTGGGFIRKQFADETKPSVAGGSMRHSIRIHRVIRYAGMFHPIAMSRMVIPFASRRCAERRVNAFAPSIPDFS